MIEKRLSLGINLSILLILIIFCVLLSLPLRLLFDTKYYNQNSSSENNVIDPKNEKKLIIPMDHRKLKRCPNLPYGGRLTSVFLNDYDRNCTYVRYQCNDEDDKDNDSGSGEEEDSRKMCGSKRGINEVLKENTEEILKARQMKSVTVAGHILVTMLLVSVIAALVEVLRVRFAREKDSSRAGTTTSRGLPYSTVDLSVASPPISKELTRSRRSFEIQGMHRSALRLLGVRPPPLLRRSSFPILQMKQATTSSLCGTPTNRITRRQSAESDEEIGIVTNALHHRIRLIRRH